MRFFRTRTCITFLALAAFSGAGCSSTRPAATGWGGKAEAANGQVAEADAGLHTQLLDILSRELDSWIGTPHVWGGTEKSGVDCSGLIQSVYASTLGVDVPRTTSEMRRFGERVQRTDLETGDLVFFRPDGDGRHVGIYMANNEFIHASSSRGVMRSMLSESYWDRYYDIARRVLTNNKLMYSAISHGRSTQNLRSEITNE